MLRPAPRKVLRKTGIVLLQVIGAIVASVVVIAVGAYAAHGIILLIAAFPWWR